MNLKILSRQSLRFITLGLIKYQYFLIKASSDKQTQGYDIKKYPSIFFQIHKHNGKEANLYQHNRDLNLNFDVKMWCATICIANLNFGWGLASYYHSCLLDCLLACCGGLVCVVIVVIVIHEIIWYLIFILWILSSSYFSEKLSTSATSNNQPLFLLKVVVTTWNTGTKNQHEVSRCNHQFNQGEQSIWGTAFRSFLPIHHPQMSLLRKDKSQIYVDILMTPLFCAHDWAVPFEQTPEWNKTSSVASTSSVSSHVILEDFDFHDDEDISWFGLEGAQW